MTTDACNLTLDIITDFWSEMTLDYRVMVEGYPNLKQEVGGSKPGCEISSLLDEKLARWSLPPVLGVGLSAFCLKTKKKNLWGKTIKNK